jgi:hypothetical protein
VDLRIKVTSSNIYLSCLISRVIHNIARSSVILLLPLFNSIPEVVMPSSYKTPKMLALASFPMDNIAFLLFLDVVKWHNSESTTLMRYECPELTSFGELDTKCSMVNGYLLLYSDK